MARSYPEKILRRFFRKFLRRNVGIVWAVLIFGGAAIFGNSAILDIANKIDVIQNVTAQEDTNALPIDSDFKIYYLDVGQGDSTIIQCDDKTMLIDAGEVDKGDTVVKALKKLGVKKIDIVVGTHPDIDHIGGLEQVLKTFESDLLFLSYVSNESNVTRSLRSYINMHGLDVTGPKVGNIYMLGSAQVRIVGPVSVYDEDNDNSISVMVTYNGKNFLFMGDTESEAEKDIVDAGINLKCDVLKLSHHGSSTSSTDILLNKANPQYAVISCASGNKHGHPHVETLEKLLKRDIKMYRTDKQGTIVLSVENGEIIFDKDPSTEYISGNGTVVTIYTGNYILNTKSKKIHLPTCKNVEDIKESNKQESSLDRQTLIDEGYSPCGYCKP